MFPSWPCGAGQNLYTFLEQCVLMAEKESPDEEFVGEPNQFLDHEGETQAEHDLKVMSGDEEVDVYHQEGREDLVESDEIEAWEEGFAEGAEGKGHLGVCAHCGAVLGDRQGEVVEKKFDDEIRLFCSDKCAQAGPQSKE